VTKVLKRFIEIELYFMVVGHTKFSPDSHFGTIKCLLHKSKVQSVLDLLDEENGLIRKSAKNNFVIAYKDPFTLKQNWEWRDWKVFLKSKFNSCIGIKDWHVIKIPGGDHFIEVSKAVSQNFSQYQIMNAYVMVDELEKPNVIEPKPTSQSRLNELQYFEKFVDDLHKAYISQEY